MISKTLYQQSVSGKIKEWTLIADPSTGIITTKWGLKGGVIQETSDTVKPKGKIGSKAYKNIAAQTQIEFDREIKRQIDKGYVEDINDVSSVTEIGKMTFDPLPVGFCPAKPIKEYPNDTELEVLFNTSKLVLQKKYDGSYCLVVKHKGKVKLYTRTLEEETENFPSIVEYMEDRLLDNSVVCGELYVGKGESMFEFDLINSMTPRTLPAKAIEKQKSNPVNIVLFDVLFWNGIDLSANTYGDRYAMQLCHCIGGNIVNNIFVNSVKNFHEAVKKLPKLNWEGYVLRDLNSKTEYTLNGKERRPKGCWKVKLIQEDDFVATGFEFGTGKNQKVAGKLQLIQYDSKGNKIDCGEVGSGFTDAQRQEVLSWKFPVVVKVQFDRRQVADGSCKLRFPVFLAKREDKLPKDCTI